jgi:hypothetical protein
MAILNVTDFQISTVLTNYLNSKVKFEAIDAGAKKLLRVNRKVAKKVMEDILNRYDIEVTYRIIAENAAPILTVNYRRKWRAK